MVDSTKIGEKGGVQPGKQPEKDPFRKPGQDDPNKQRQGGIGGLGEKEKQR